MFKKIAIGALVVVFAGALIAGGIYRTTNKLNKTALKCALYLLNSSFARFLELSPSKPQALFAGLSSQEAFPEQT